MKRTNAIMDEIRASITSEQKVQMELAVSIANRIYAILEQRGMTQKEFAHLMGKTETEVSRWLSGTHNLTLSTIAKITVALGETIITPVAPVSSSYKHISDYKYQYLSDSK